MTKAERTRQMIIEQAAPIINEKGIAGTSIDDVLKASKVAKGCLYGHFESKDALCNATADYLLDQLDQKVRARLKQEQTAKAKLYAFMDMNKDPLEPCVPGGCPILNLSTEADSTNELIRGKVSKHITGSRLFLTRIIEQGIKAGEFSPELDAATFALKLFATVEGAHIISRVSQSNKPMHMVIQSLQQELETYCIAAKT